ncbi:hypothetical protein HMPREF1014_05581 [Bacillus sp. 7_6_55CFAA_CT2]|uniref:hypothetical protein n=1 Tax=Bacillus sp. 7_6_55CFAA_CT2 TaxID=665957 RepID=UPI000241120F|nr:hypothetical protein [Bacillus sp. 7_6_55CFAA_CT2]EHL64971.1 hypothetical protein HMPREF1014_05581 [Bacillus sp. 7_6_55CFAA_CT2]
MNAVERENKISKLKSEINNIWISLAIGSVFYLLGWLCLEPMLKELANLGGVENKPLAYVQKMFFDYAMVGMFWIGYIIGLIAIFKKKSEIRRYKKEKDTTSKINIQKGDINQYEKGDRDTMKRVFNQNNKVFTNKTRSKGSPIRSYNGSTRSANSIESNNIALGDALESSIYSTGNDNDCSSSSSSNYHSSGSDYSSCSSSYSSSSSDYSSSSSSNDGGSSCD